MVLDVSSTNLIPTSQRMLDTKQSALLTIAVLIVSSNVSNKFLNNTRYRYSVSFKKEPQNMFQMWSTECDYIIITFLAAWEVEYSIVY